MRKIKFYLGKDNLLTVIDDGCDWVKYFYKEDGEIKSDWQNKRVLLNGAIEVKRGHIEYRQPELIEAVEGYLSQKKAV